MMPQKKSQFLVDNPIRNYYLTKTTIYINETKKIYKVIKFPIFLDDQPLDPLLLERPQHAKRLPQMRQRVWMLLQATVVWRRMAPPTQRPPPVVAVVVLPSPRRRLLLEVAGSVAERSPKRLQLQRSLPLVRERVVIVFIHLHLFPPLHPRQQRHRPAQQQHQLVVVASRPALAVDVSLPFYFHPLTSLKIAKKRFFKQQKNPLQNRISHIRNIFASQ
jgi:hypothetical protein